MNAGERAVTGSPSDAEPPIAFSVVIPTHQNRRSVIFAVESVLRQSHPHFEVIVVSDGDFSTTQRILEDISDPRMRIIEQPLASGVALARNLGIDAAENPWVTFLDDDDVARPNWLNAWDSIISPASAAVTGCVSYRRDHGPAVMRECRLSLTDTTTAASTILAGGFAVRRDILRAVRGYDPQLRAAENQDLGLRICEYIVASGMGDTISHTQQVVANVFVENSVKRAIRYTDSQSQSAKLFLERYANRLAADPRGTAALLRIISRAERNAGNYLPARAIAWRACRADLFDRDNWRVLVAALLARLVHGRSFNPPAPWR